jgi:hypothetical protein
MPRTTGLLTLTALAVAVVLPAVPAFAQDGGVAPDWQVNRSRAQASYRSMQEYFYLRSQHLYRGTSPWQAGNPYSYLWPFREAMAGTIDMTRVPRVGKAYSSAVFDRLKGLSRYWDNSKSPPGYASYLPPPLGQGGDLNYDDNDVVALELLRWHHMTRNASALSHAQQIFPLLLFGWDTNPAHPCPGGELWTQGTWTAPIRAANSTGLGAEVALRLYEATAQDSYLEWGKKMYQWNRTCLHSPEGLYWNDMDFNGVINKTFWIYNSGAMIGASGLLYRITGDSLYLQQAQGDADAALQYFGSADRYNSQPAIFNAIFFKNLLLLDSLHHDPQYRQPMQAYADQVWNEVRDPVTGLFPFAPSQPVQLLDQAAMVQIYASLAWAPRDYKLIV